MDSIKERRQSILSKIRFLKNYLHTYITKILRLLENTFKYVKIDDFFPTPDCRRHSFTTKIKQKFISPFEVFIYSFFSKQRMSFKFLDWKLQKWKEFYLLLWVHKDPHTPPICQLFKNSFPLYPLFSSINKILKTNSFYQPKFKFNKL